MWFSWIQTVLSLGLTYIKCGASLLTMIGLLDNKGIFFWAECWNIVKNNLYWLSLYDNLSFCFQLFHGKIIGFELGTSMNDDSLSRFYIFFIHWLRYHYRYEKQYTFYFTYFSKVSNVSNGMAMLLKYTAKSGHTIGNNLHHDHYCFFQTKDYVSSMFLESSFANIKLLVSFVRWTKSSF